jgi:hypothetical protein
MREAEMDELERYRRRQAKKWQALRRLGVRDIYCSICGETDPICFEADHIERRKYSDTVCGLCKNCHAKVTARQESEHPPVRTDPEDHFERKAHALLGASTYLALISDRLWEIGEFLLKLKTEGITLKD